MLHIIVPFLLVQAIVFSIALLFLFINADADFTLLLKRKVKREEFEDKVVWITGASRGIVSVESDCFVLKEIFKLVERVQFWICFYFSAFLVECTGEILAKQLCGLGAKLIISARNVAELERVKTELTGKHAQDVKILPVDLGSGEANLREAVERAESLFPGFGVDFMKSPALDASEESLKATFDINVLGIISLANLLAPYMLRRGKGHFVVMSSAAGKTPAPGQAIYSASKFAVNGYFHTLRSELCQKGIKVTVVCPGPIDTSKGSAAGNKTEKRYVSSERCAELTLVAASHGLKEAWISDQPVLAVMCLAQYMPSIGFWLMDKIGTRRVEAAAQKGNTYSFGLLFGKSKKQ